MYVPGFGTNIFWGNEAKIDRTSVISQHIGIRFERRKRSQSTETNTQREDCGTRAEVLVASYLSSQRFRFKTTEEFQAYS